MCTPFLFRRRQLAVVLLACCTCYGGPAVGAAQEPADPPPRPAPPAGADRPAPPTEDEQIPPRAQVHILGMTVVPDRNDLPIVIDVNVFSPAWYNGMRTEDRILAFSGIDVSSFEEWRKIAREVTRRKGEGEAVTLTIARGGEKLQVQLPTLGTSSQEQDRRLAQAQAARDAEEAAGQNASQARPGSAQNQLLSDEDRQRLEELSQLEAQNRLTEQDRLALRNLRGRQYWQPLTGGQQEQLLSLLGPDATSALPAEQQQQLEQLHQQQQQGGTLGTRAANQLRRLQGDRDRLLLEQTSREMWQLWNQYQQGTLNPAQQQRLQQLMQFIGQFNGNLQGLLRQLDGQAGGGQQGLQGGRAQQNRPSQAQPQGNQQQPQQQQPQSSPDRGTGGSTGSGENNR